MTISMHPPAHRQCQIYSEVTSVRCINEGERWVSWGRFHYTDGSDSEGEFYSWECHGPHRFGEAA